MEDILDTIQRLAQKYLSAKPVVILGSGASIPHGLPSMPELSNSLTKSVKSTTDSWLRFQELLRRDNNLEDALHQVELDEPTLSALIRSTWEIVNRADLGLLDLLVTRETSLPLTDLLTYLLRTADRTASVVTTNYDRLAEYGACLADAEPFTGFSPGAIQRFIAQPSPLGMPRTISGLSGRVDIWKVHGSLDWFTSPLLETVGLPATRSIPIGLTPLIVTPGVTKYRETHKDPFRTVMSCSDSVLRTAQSFLCIGYGFNDDHVQPELLQRARRSVASVVIITKELSRTAKEAFLNGTCRNFLLLESSNDGTRAFMPDHRSGVHIPGVELWSLRGFLDNLILQQRGIG